MTTDIRLGAVILCGGKSTRLGQNKALLKIGSMTFLERTAATLANICQPLVLVGEFGKTNLPSQYADLDGLANATWTSDQRDNMGPLEGIREGLAKLEPTCNYAFVTCCDSPLIKLEVVQDLTQIVIENNKSVETRGVVPVDGNRVYGLTAIYTTSLHREIGERIEHGNLRVSDLAELEGVENIGLERLRKSDPDLVSLLNVNSLEDHELLLKRL